MNLSYYKVLPLSFSLIKLESPYSVDLRGS